ncbi:MAG: arsenate reductase [Sneathiellales bacterium]|nr:arsenate reductase [Sneathiellales bacterium]
MITIYGIKNCDTVRKALKWAEEQGIESRFHDFRKDPVDAEMVQSWMEAVGKDILINKRGTTYRKLDEAGKQTLEGEGAYALLAEQPTLMKRPVFDLGEAYIVGFKDAEKKAVLDAINS